MEKLLNAMKTEIATTVAKTVSKNLKDKLNEDGSKNKKKEFWIGNFHVKINVH